MPRTKDRRTLQNPPCPQLCQEESGLQSQEAISLRTRHDDDDDDDDGDDDGDVDGDDQKGNEDEDVDENDP